MDFALKLVHASVKKVFFKFILGWTGQNCEERVVVHGQIIEGVVKCDEGWEGTSYN